MQAIVIDPAGSRLRSTRSVLLTRSRKISLAMILASPLITAAMSLAFYGRVLGTMIATSLVCAIVIDRLVHRITRHYRERIREAHALLEQRVKERTADLERANQTLVETRHELMVRDRMATAGMLAAGVSHEIRSPLTVIRIAIDDVRDQLGDAPGELQQQLADVSDAAERIAAIVRDLSSLARPVDDPLGPTELGAVVESATRLATYRLGKATIVREPIAVPPVLGNASRLVQLVLNLLVNAARATRPDAPNTIRVGAEAVADRIVLTIRDTGTGMSPEVRARLFEPFFTTGGTTGGTGLGLVICRSLVEKMGGTIAIDSALGEGTTVRITLRRA